MAKSVLIRGFQSDRMALMSLRILGFCGIALGLGLLYFDMRSEATLVLAAAGFGLVAIEAVHAYGRANLLWLEDTGTGL
jgi:hypothetical protein